MEEATASCSPTITVDAHVDVPWLMTKHGQIDLRKPSCRMVDFPAMRKGYLDSIICALYLSDSMQNDYGEAKSWLLLQAQLSWLKYQLGSQVVHNAKAARFAHADGLVPIFIGLEGGRLLGGSKTWQVRLEWLHLEGLKYLTLTHNFNTAWADSATDVPKHNGLTAFGYKVLDECKKLGILIDISHASDATAYAAINYLGGGVIASHSGCRALVDHPRNLSDNLIRALAKAGGIVHIPFARRFVETAYGVIDHIDHVVQVTGSVKFVGIGSDMDGANMVYGADTAADWGHIVMDGLSRRGYSPVDIAQIAGENTLSMLE